MKIICIEQVTEEQEPNIFIKPDSSLLSKYNPFHVPAFSKQVECNLNLIVKINRIGKCISKDFAHKYYDKLSVGVNFTDADLLKSLKDKNLSWEKATAFDGSMAIGDFFSKPDFLKYTNTSIKINGDSIEQIVLKDTEDKIEDAIYMASKFFTLKIGDALAIQLSKKVPINHGNIIETQVNDEKTLYLKIK